MTDQTGSSIVEDLEKKHPLLYHYTSEVGLRGIVKSNSIWATFFEDLNDAKEIRELRNPLAETLSVRLQVVVERFARKGEREWRIVAAQGGNAHAARTIANKWVRALYRVTFEEPKEARSSFCCVASFCSHISDQAYEQENGLLSQWRGYGGGGGYCIVFDTAKLAKLIQTEAAGYAYAYTDLQPAYYLKDLPTAPLFESLLLHSESIIADAISGKDFSTDGAVLPFVSSATTTKHRAFYEEREVRIIAIPITELADKKLRGILYSSHSLLELVSQCSTTTQELLESFRRIEVANSEDVIVISQQCSWVELSAAGQVRLTDLGQKVIMALEPAERLRMQLCDVVKFQNPAWTKRLVNGRKEALKGLPTDIEQIFDEAGLLDDWNDDLLRFWDDLGLSVRAQRSELNFRTGREAERLTYEHEAKRTKRCPDWKARDTTFAGYDILSVVDEQDHALLPIEVKGTVQSPKEAFFFVSRHEWETAKSSQRYDFYLWSIRSNPELRIVSSKDISAHIANDAGDGCWDAIKIPFKTFW